MNIHTHVNMYIFSCMQSISTYVRINLAITMFVCMQYIICMQTCTYICISLHSFNERLQREREREAATMKPKTNVYTQDKTTKTSKIER